MIRHYKHLILILILSAIFACGTTKRFHPAKVADKHNLDYPISAQLDKIEGDVVIGVFVNTDGTPEESKILESSGHTVLDSAAFRFVNGLHFEPATVDEQPIASWTRLVLKYKLTEIAFEEKRWLDDVAMLQKQIAASLNPGERLNFQRKLYIRYIGLADYVEKYDQLEINNVIEQVIAVDIREEWKLLWDLVPAPFTVFDDFLSRYPDCAINSLVTEELIKQMIEAEGQVRVRSLTSAKIARSANQIIERIERRLNELQPVLKVQ